MTDLAAALANTDLGKHEGDDVLSVGIEIPGAAGGLRDALKIDPVVKHRGDEVLVLIKAKVGKLRYDPVKDTEGVRRVHVLDVESATIVEGEVYEDALDSMAERIQLAKEAAAGVQRIDFGGDAEAAALAEDHEAGKHSDGLRDGCPICQTEVEAEEAEAE